MSFPLAPSHAPPSVEALTPTVLGFASNSTVRGQGPHNGISDLREEEEDTEGRPLSVNQDERPPQDPTSRTMRRPQSAVLVPGSLSQDHASGWSLRSQGTPTDPEPHLRLLALPAGPSESPWMHQVFSLVGVSAGCSLCQDALPAFVTQLLLGSVYPSGAQGRPTDPHLCPLHSPTPQGTEGSPLCISKMGQ